MAVRLEERVWDAVKEMLVDTEILRQAYYQALQLDVDNRSHSRILLESRPYPRLCQPGASLNIKKVLPRK